MPGPCSGDFERLAQELGAFGCDTANAVLNLHNPFGLDHWTMLVIEAATVIGVVLALRHALHRRRQGDSTALAIWIAALAYLVVVEPPLYFPQNFGLQDEVGLIFVHNQFTVQFLYDRLPLYIVSFYPVLALLSYEIVRKIGVFERRGPFVSAVTVGFVYHVFYEFFDHVGPQLHWWIWNQGAPTNEPFLASVPISSMVNFAVMGPIALTFLVRVLIAGHKTSAAMPMQTLVGRSVLAGFLMPLGLVLGGLPASLLALGDEPNRTGQAISYWLELGVVGVIALVVIVEAQRHRSGRVEDPVDRRYLVTHGSIYLAALVVSWAAALPGYFSATDGITADGTPIGSLPYAIACAVFAVGFLLLALGRPSRGVPPDPEPVGSARESDAVAS